MLDEEIGGRCERVEIGHGGFGIVFLFFVVLFLAGERTGLGGGIGIGIGIGASGGNFTEFLLLKFLLTIYVVVHIVCREIFNWEFSIVGGGVEVGGGGGGGGERILI